MTYEDNLRSQAAVYDAECDREWRHFEDTVGELERVVEELEGEVQRAVGLVIIQAYLNGIHRKFEEWDEDQS